MSFKSQMEMQTGYSCITTFFEDFSIADKFGVDAVKDTYARVLKEWKHDYKYLTELVMILNWKIWQYYNHKDELANVYNELWQKADNYACEHLKGEELSYFYQTTD